MSDKKDLDGAPDTRFLTPRQLARALQISPRSVYRRILDGMPYSRVGGKTRLDLDEVRVWLTKKR